MPYKAWATNDVPTANDFNAMFGDAQVNVVATSQSTTSTSFTNLATAGPTVSSLQMVAGQQAWVFLSAVMSISGGPGHDAQMGYQVTGAATISPAADDTCSTQSVEDARHSQLCVFTAPVSGSYTFQAKYIAVNGTTATFASRRLIVKKW